MIYKKGVPSTRLPEILQGCSKRVKEVVGADITFTVKDMDEGYAALKVSDIKFELLTDPDMLLMVEKGIRGV